MLQFFRKYQKFFFFIVTFFVVVSFSFFGTFKTQMAQTTIAEKVLGKGIDGSKVTDRDIHAIKRLVAGNTDKSGLPNLLNDQIIQTTFLETGLAKQIATAYFPLLKDEIQERYSKMRSYRPYEHPEAPMLSQKEIWKSFAPSLHKRFENLAMETKDATPQTFDLIANFYLEARSVPHGFVKQMLGYQQKQYASFLRPDPLFEQRNFSVFGFESLRDWFGDRYLDVLSQCIHNIALVAKEKGYKVTVEEAKVNLFTNAARAAKRYIDPKVTDQEIQNYVKQEIYMLGVEEKKAYQAWQKVLLCKRLLDEVGEAVFVDTLMGDELGSYANQSAEVEAYQLPQELRLRNFSDLVAFQVYLENVAPKFAGSLELPTAFESVSAIRERCPELVEKKFYLEIKQANIADLSMDVSLKETWKWEVADANWSRLQREFPELEKANATTQEARMEVLDRLEETKRFELDQFAREQIILSDADLIQKALAEATPKKEWVSFRASKKGNLSLKGIKDQSALQTLLETQDDLVTYTQDRNTYYTIHVIERSKDDHLLTFGEAKRDKVFKQLVDSNLEQSYAKVRDRNPSLFKAKDGTWKPYREVQDQIGALLYASLLRKLEKEEGNSETKYTFDFYATHRFAPFMKKAKAALVKDPNDPNWVGKKGWRLVKATKTVSRNESAECDAEDLFTLPEGAWTSVKVPADGNVTLYRILARKASKDGEKGTLTAAKKLLADEARREAMQKMIERFKEKGVIYEPPGHHDEIVENEV